jgi:hypothetical protein
MDMTTSRPRQTLTDAEVDAYSRWEATGGRSWARWGYASRPGVRKSIKRITHKRERRQGRREATLDA